MPSQLESLNTEIIACRKCPRLVAWREEVARVKRKAYRDQEYWGKPVPGFGDPKARVLVVKDLYITAVARCVPPDNKPSLEELKNCQPYLERELEIIKPKVIVCLGRIAYERILKIFSIRDSSMKFAHGATFDLRPSNFQPATLLCSYHPSQQNTLTGKLTVKMFDDIWRKTEDLLK